MTHNALGIIDVQRGFTPETAEYPAGHGFGELPVPGGHEIIEPVNRLLGAFATGPNIIFTTQDWHPHRTAHFADDNSEPNFTTTWPRHCVDGTLGAELHPGLVLPAQRERFIKGFETLERGEDDTSYSGYYAEDPITGCSLPEMLQKYEISRIVLGGLALDYCVGKTALDLRNKCDLDVVVAIDATRGISEATNQAMLQQFEIAGITVATTDEILAMRSN